MNYKKIIILMAAAALIAAGCGKSGKSSSGKTHPRFGSGNNEILSFGFTSQKNSALGADIAGIISGDTIEVTVPHGTDVKALVAVFVTDSTDVTVNDVPQISGETPNDFSSDVIYDVTVNDDIRTYTVRVKAAPSSEKTISRFYLNRTEGTIDPSTGIINVSLAPKTPLTALTAQFEAVCKKVLIGGVEQVSGETVNNFTGDVTYTVMADDNSTREYTVKAVVQKSTSKAINSFSFIRDEEKNINLSLAAPATVTFTGTEINVVLPYGSAATDLVATFTSNGEKVTVSEAEQVSGETHNNFSSPVIYVVEAEDGSKESYTVNVTIAKNSARSITSFILDGENAVIDEDAGTITVVFPQTKNISALAAQFSTTGSSVTVNGTEQVSGTTTNDFSANPVYRVTADDGSVKDYSVSVTRSADIAGIWNFSETGNADYTTSGAVWDKDEGALMFDGYDDYVLVPDNDAFTLAKAGSVEAVVKLISHKPFAGIVHKGVRTDFKDETFSLQYWGSKEPYQLRFLVTNVKDESSNIDIDMPLIAGEWCHIVATWDVNASEICIYINGSLKGKGAITTGDCRDSNGALIIGAQLPVLYASKPAWGNLGFNGYIDRVRILNRALTPDEIADRYSAFNRESSMTAFILKVAPQNKPLLLTILLVLAAIIGGMWVKNRLKIKQ